MQEYVVPLDVFYRDLRAEKIGIINQHSVQNSDLAMSLLQTRSLQRATLSSGHTMYFLLNIYNQTRCSDPRDRIFALIGPLKQGDGLRDIFPDYNLSCG